MHVLYIPYLEEIVTISTMDVLSVILSISEKVLWHCLGLETYINGCKYNSEEKYMSIFCVEDLNIPFISSQACYFIVRIPSSKKLCQTLLTSLLKLLLPVIASIENESIHFETDKN